MDTTLIDRRNEIRKRLIPLEWDMKRKQINFAKELQLKAYKEELEKIEKEIAGGNNAEIV